MTIKTWTQRLNEVSSEDLRSKPHPQITAESRDWYCCAVGEKLKIPKPFDSRTVDEGQTVLADAVKEISPLAYELGNVFPTHLERTDVAKARFAVTFIGVTLSPDRIEKIRKKYVKDMQFLRRAAMDLKGTLERELGI